MPRSIEAAFERELEVFRGETEGALQFFYAWLTVHAVAAEDGAVLRAMNRTPLFWNTTLGALQATTFIVLGRIFDPDTRNHSVSRLLSLAHANMGIFSRAALADRKRRQSANADEWLPGYLRTAYEPTSEDFRRLKRYVAERRRLYESNYRDLRHMVFAHRSQTDEAQREALFARTNIRELQKILAFLARLYEALWQMHFNGAKPTLRQQPYSVQRIRERLQPRHKPSRVQEKIVHETEQLLKTVASAA